MSEIAEHSVTIPMSDYEAMKFAVNELANIEEKISSGQKIVLDYSYPKGGMALKINGELKILPYAIGEGEFEAKMNKQIAEFAEEVNNLRSEKSQLNQDFHLTIRELEDKKKELAELMGEIGRLHTKNKDLGTMYKRLDSKNSELEGKCEALLTIIEKLKTKLKNSLRERSAWKRLRIFFGLNKKQW